MKHIVLGILLSPTNLKIVSTIIVFFFLNNIFLVKYNIIQLLHPSIELTVNEFIITV